MSLNGGGGGSCHVAEEGGEGPVMSLRWGRGSCC